MTEFDWLGIAFTTTAAMRALMPHPRQAACRNGEAVMNTEAISQITFYEPFVVGPEHVASKVHSGLLDVLSTAHLLAAVESMCIGCLQQKIDRPEWTVVGVGMRIHHRAPAVPGETAWVRGWVFGVRDASAGCGATFRVDVRCGDRELADFEIDFAIVQAQWVRRRLQRMGEGEAAAAAA